MAALAWTVYEEVWCFTLKTSQIDVQLNSFIPQFWIQHLYHCSLRVEFWIQHKLVLNGYTCTENVLNSFCDVLGGLAQC